MTQNGFLLSYTKFGDHDAVLHCFTEEAGFQSFFLRGIYTAKNRKKAYLQPLNELRMTINPRGGGLLSLTKIEPRAAANFNEDLTAVNIAFFVADFANQILREAGAQQNIYVELQRVRTELSACNYRAHLVFLLRMLKLLGFYPLLNNKEFLNPESGTFEETIAHQIFNTEISAYWKLLAEAEKPYNFVISGKQTRALLESAILYYRLHFPNFSQPKSLEVLREIYQ